MPGETKVDQTLREVIGTSVNKQTQEKSTVDNSQQTQSGEKREFISGIDVSDLPDNLTKSELKELLAKKGKLIEDGYQGKFKEIAEYKKERDALLAQGVSIKDAARIIQDAIKKTDTKTEAKTEIKREIDSLKEEAPDAETRKGVERLEKVIKELAPDSPAFKELKKDIDEIKKSLNYVANKTIASRVDNLNESLDKLSGEKFDKDFIEKYREKIIEEGKKFPDAPINKIIQVITDPDDYDAALLRTKKKEETKERSVKEKINANDSASSGVTGSDKQPDVKKVSVKGLLSHLMSQKK